MEQRPSHDWSYTQGIINELGDNYRGRHLIGRDSDVRGGVYYGLYGGEAIVVDPATYPEQYQRYYQQVVAFMAGKAEINAPRILQAVFKTVYTNMLYSDQAVAASLQKVAHKYGQASFVEGSKVELSVFMAEGVGVCRHQALTCAALLEQFKDQGKLRGTISVDRNARLDPLGGTADGHAWVRYASHNGPVYILDVAQNYFGLLPSGRRAPAWNYSRPEDRLQ